MKCLVLWSSKACANLVNTGLCSLGDHSQADAGIMHYSSGTISHSVARWWSDFLRNIWHFPALKKVSIMLHRAGKQNKTQDQVGIIAQQPHSVMIAAPSIKFNHIYLTFIKLRKAHWACMPFFSNILLHSLTHSHLRVAQCRQKGKLKAELLAQGCFNVLRKGETKRGQEKRCWYSIKNELMSNLDTKRKFTQIEILK